MIMNLLNEIDGNNFISFFFGYIVYSPSVLTYIASLLLSFVGLEMAPRGRKSFHPHYGQPFRAVKATIDAA